MGKEFETVTPESVGIESSAIMELLDELNLIHNHTRQILMHEKDARKQSWTLPRKHYSRKDLAKKGLFKDYEYLDLLAIPRIRRQCYYPFFHTCASK